MIHKAHIVGFVRPHPRHAPSVQREMMAARDVTRIYDDLALCIRQRRHGKGDVVAVKALALLAEPRDRRKLGGLRASLYAALDAIEAAGAIVWELDSNRRTSDPRQRDLMLREAIDTMARARPGARPPGRRPKEWSAEQHAIMWRHWPSRAHATDSAALVAIREAGVPASRRQVTKVCGASGRTPGAKRKQR